jgi:hypothetical protein
MEARSRCGAKAMDRSVALPRAISRRYRNGYDESHGQRDDEVPRRLVHQSQPVLAPDLRSPQLVNRRCGALCASEVEQVGTLGLVELTRPGECLQHRLRDAGGLAALELRVVRDADAGEKGDLFAAKSRDSAWAVAVAGGAGLLRRDLPAP